jgi:hypothetical protein
MTRVDVDQFRSILVALDQTEFRRSKKANFTNEVDNADTKRSNLYGVRIVKTRY